MPPHLTRSKAIAAIMLGALTAFAVLAASSAHAQARQSAAALERLTDDAHGHGRTAATLAACKLDAKTVAVFKKAYKDFASTYYNPSDAASLSRALEAGQKAGKEDTDCDVTLLVGGRMSQVWAIGSAAKRMNARLIPYTIVGDSVGEVMLQIHGDGAFNLLACIDDDGARAKLGADFEAGVKQYLSARDKTSLLGDDIFSPLEHKGDRELKERIVDDKFRTHCPWRLFRVGQLTETLRAVNELDGSDADYWMAKRLHGK